MHSLLYEENNSIAKIILNRPSVLNALNYPLLLDLEKIIGNIKTNRNIRAVIITGSGEKAFCVGADLKERLTLSNLEVIRNLNKMNELFCSIEKLPQITICSMNGHALGGGLELALACDFRIASNHALIGFPETSLGIIPGAGGTQRLSRLIGVSKALQLIISAKKISSQEALLSGIVTEVVPQEKLNTAVNQFISTFINNAPIALEQAKFAVKVGASLDLQSGLAIERKAYEATLSTEDRLEALKAFNEKRKPTFKGK